MLPFAIQRRGMASAHTSTKEQWFLAPLADISSKVCQGLHSPKGYARFLRITMALLSQAPHLGSCRLRRRNYSRPLASELDVKVSLHPAQAWNNAPGCACGPALAGRGFDICSPLA